MYRPLLLQTGHQKMRTPNILCSEDSLGHLNGLGRRAAQHFGRFLHQMNQMKGRQQIDSKKGRILYKPSSEE
jgi:hypothetical protein